MPSAMIKDAKREELRREKAIALAHRPKRGKCRDCRERRAEDCTGNRCLSCWAVACAHFSWNGFQQNAFKHATRH